MRARERRTDIMDAEDRAAALGIDIREVEERIKALEIVMNAQLKAIRQVRSDRLVFKI